MHVFLPLQLSSGKPNLGKVWGISGRHGKSPGLQNPLQNSQESKIPGKAKSPGLQKPRDSKFLGTAQSPGGQNPQDNKIPGTAKSREIPGRNC